jgi:hypothetical protein
MVDLDRIDPPVQRRMGIENLEPTHDQNEQTDDVDPMADTNRQPMPVHSFYSLLRSDLEP